MHKIANKSPILKRIYINLADIDRVSFRVASRCLHTAFAPLDELAWLLQSFVVGKNQPSMSVAQFLSVVQRIAKSSDGGLTVAAGLQSAELARAGCICAMHAVQKLTNTSLETLKDMWKVVRQILSPVEYLTGCLPFFGGFNPRDRFNQHILRHIDLQTVLSTPLLGLLVNHEPSDVRSLLFGGSLTKEARADLSICLGALIRTDCLTVIAAFFDEDYSDVFNYKVDEWIVHAYEHNAPRCLLHLLDIPNRIGVGGLLSRGLDANFFDHCKVEYFSGYFLSYKSGLLFEIMLKTQSRIITQRLAADTGNCGFISGLRKLSHNDRDKVLERLQIAGKSTKYLIEAAVAVRHEPFVRRHLRKNMIAPEKLKEMFTEACTSPKPSAPIIQLIYNQLRCSSR